MCSRIISVPHRERQGARIDFVFQRLDVHTEDIFCNLLQGAYFIRWWSLEIPSNACDSVKYIRTGSRLNQAYGLMTVVAITSTINWVALENTQNLNICCYLTIESRAEKLPSKKKSRWTNPHLLLEDEKQVGQTASARGSTIFLGISTSMSPLRKRCLSCLIALSFFTLNSLHLTAPQGTWRAVARVCSVEACLDCDLSLQKKSQMWA